MRRLVAAESVFLAIEKRSQKENAHHEGRQEKTSVLDKIGLETKNFFDRAGETLGLKKPAPKKYGYARALGPRVQTHKKAESKSWLSPMFEPEEPKRPRNVTDWMGQPRQDL